MLSLVNAQSHPFRLTIALYHAACFHQLRRETSLTQEQAGALLALSQEQGFGLYRAGGTILSGWARAEKSQHAAGIEQEYQSLAAREVMGAEVSQPYFLAVLAETCGKIGRALDGLTLLADALGAAQRKQTQIYTAELCRLTGELTLHKEFQVQGSKFQVTDPRSPTPNPQAEAERYFLKAIAIARKQQAKSLELRATMSLVRLRQQQAAQSASCTTHHETRVKLDKAHNMLSDIYHWFTEGFDTKDLKEARMLLEELSH
jgi:predicted ATPase